MAGNRPKKQAIMKSYTDINQSKKLAEILPFESADMWWLYVTSQGKRIAMMYEEPDPHYLARMEGYGIKDAAIRCWSLAALLEFLSANFHVDIKYLDNYWELDCRVQVTYNKELVDACYEMIIKLNELKRL